MKILALTITLLLSGLVSGCGDETPEFVMWCMKEKSAPFAHKKRNCVCLYNTLRKAKFSDQQLEWWRELFIVSQYSKIKVKHDAQLKIEDYISDNDVYETCNQAPKP